MRAHRSLDRRGSTAVQVLVALPAMLGAAALAIDLGNLRVARATLQDVADASALASASALGSDEAVRATAERVAAAHVLAGQRVSVEEVEVGIWDGADLVAAPGAPETDAVRVTVGVERVDFAFAGLLGWRSTSIRASATVAASATRTGGGCGLMSDGDFSMGGTPEIDSYVAADGPYGGANRYEDANACANGDFTQNGTPDVHGDVWYGPGRSYAASGNPTVTGSVAELPFAVALEPVDCAEVRVRNDNARLPRAAMSGTSFRTNRDVALPGGTYFLTGFTVGGSASVTIEGPVVLCVDGDVDVRGGGVVNPSRLPSDLRVRVDSTESVSRNGELSWAGNSDFYGVIDAPGSEIDLGGTAAYYGVFVGADVTLRGTGDVHVDEGLAAEIAPILTRSRVALVR